MKLVNHCICYFHDGSSREGSTVAFYNSLSNVSRVPEASASSPTNRGYSLNTDYTFLGSRGWQHS